MRQTAGRGYFRPDSGGRLFRASAELKGRKCMRTTKRILCIVLALALTVALGVTAGAKTSSAKIDAPAADEIAFYIGVGTKTVNFTWSDINGKGELKTVTATYSAKVDGELTKQEWTGVRLSDMLARAEKKLGVTIADDAVISAKAADGYTVAFTAADVRDEEQRYIVAADAVSNSDGENTYANSYARILCGDEETLPNKSNIRCVLGVSVANADGSAIKTAGKTEGGNVENSVFYIAVKDGDSFKFYYYTREELEQYDNVYDFDYTDHSVDKIVAGRGAALKNLLADITDSTITGDMIVQYAESDGYHADRDTPIEDSAYKDKVEWLSGEHLTSGGETAAAVETVICYSSWTTYDNPDENNVNSTKWDDADAGSGYLRAYRQRDDANSAVIKTLMGVVISASGQEFTGKDGYMLKAESTEGNAMRIIEPSTGKVYAKQSVTGLVPGMKYAVKSADIANAEVSGDKIQVITAAEGTDTVVTFTYKENSYLSCGETVYTLSSFEAMDKMTQTPSKDEVSEHGTPYGYYNAMYYRYNGVWLSDLVSGDVTVKGTDGTAITVAAADLDRYFLASGYTASKSTTNVSEGKRFTFAYAAPQLIIPGDGTLVGEAEAANEGNKMVTVAVKAVAAVVSGAEAAPEFKDMAGYAWATEAVNALRAQGIVNGQSAAAFGPAASIKRGDFILMLVRAYDLKADAKDNFADVAEGSYWYDAIAAAKALEIAKGDGTSFKPESSITRQEAMTLLCRALKAAGKDLSAYSAELKDYADGDTVADWAADSVKTLVGAGVINGRDGAIQPAGGLTRAEMAVALYRALTVIK